MEVYGQWPWRRDVLAGVIEELRVAEVGVIVLPILFSEISNIYKFVCNDLNKLAAPFSEILLFYN